MEENAYVLLDLESINVTTKKTNNDIIVFCNSITVKKREDQSFNNIKFDDWSNIIIGAASKYNDENIDNTIDNINVIRNNDNSITVIISTIDTNSGIVTLKENIGLWSMILFTTTADEDGIYKKLENLLGNSTGIGGSGTSDTGVEEVYYNTNITSYVNNATVVDAFLLDALGREFGNDHDKYIFNGCIFIDNSNCGLFLNIAVAMFNNQTNLEKISLTNTIVYIAKNTDTIGVFSNCNTLVKANIPRYLGYYQIMGDSDISTNDDRVVPRYYFHNCESLETITIPTGITQIEISAFYGCDNVETIDIPSSVTIVNSNSLLTVKRENTRYINVIGDVGNKTDITFFGKSVGYTKPSGINPDFRQNTVIISINDRKKVKLNGLPNLNDNTSFIDNIGAGSKIYIDCKEIDGVKTGTDINSTARFYHGGFIGTSFDTIYIGPSVETICDFAFYNAKVTNLIINNTEVLKESYNTKDEDNIIKENVYPDGTYLIKTPFIKTIFNNIDILNCTTIGEYALHNIICNNLTFYEQDVSLEINDNLTITNTTTLETLSNYAFYNSHFGSITIPSTVTSNDINNTNISNTTFLQTTGSLVLNCDISNYETTINQNTRTGILVNSRFSKINFNYDVKGIIPENILYENEYIQLIELSEGIKSISTKAFYLCTNLSNTLTIPSTLTEISSDAFIGCRFSEFISSSDNYQTGNDGMYLLKESNIVLFANRHADIQIVDNTFDIINIEGVTGIGDYAFAYAFSDSSNSTVFAVNIPTNIKNFGSNVFYNSNKITRITFFASNIPDFGETESEDYIISVRTEDKSYSELNTIGSFVDLPLLKEVYIGYVKNVLLSNYFSNDEDKNTWFLHNTLRKSYTNRVPSVDGITIYVHEDLVDGYVIWENAGYTIVGISKGDTPPPPEPPTEDDDKYDADIDDPEGEDWPDDGGNGDISDEEDYIPPVIDIPTEEGNDNWIVSSDNNGFNVTIKQLGTPSINVYGCRLDLLNTTYHNDELPPNTEIIDQFGNINFSSLDYLKFNKVSNKNLNESTTDDMLKLYLGDYGNNFLIVFTVTGIDNFDATTKLFTSGVEYATHRESNWLKTEIVRITKKPKENANEDNIYYVVLLCTCLKLQNKDNYNCRNAIVSVNYGSQLLDSDERITTKIRVIQHKTELRLSNDTREINITDLPVLFCQNPERTTFTGNFFIGFPKNFWGNGDTINTDGTSANKNKLREYINDYFRILYDKEKINVIGQKINIDGLDYTYTFNVNDKKYANIKSEGSTTGTLMTFELCKEKYGDKYEDKLKEIHEEYYCVNFKIENLKTSLAGGVWNISIYNICEPAEMLNIHVVEDKTDIPSISVMFEGTFDVENYEGYDKVEGKYIFVEDKLNTNMCYAIDDLTSVRMKLALPTVVTGIPTYKKDGAIHKIYPSEELIDLCVDKSVVNMCGLSLLGNNIGNVYNAFTTQINKTPIRLGVSSNNILSNSLNNIKFVSSGSIKQSLYNYKVNSSNSITNRYEILQSCSRNTSLIKTQRMGDSANEILENTETYIYIIDTGYSALNTTKDNTNKTLYSNYLYSGQQNGETILNSNTVSDVNEPVHHNESSETGVYIEANNVLTDTYYDVLAPLYQYVYENMYNGVKTIDINPNVKLENIDVYYCTSYKSDCVVDNGGNVYILKDKTDYTKTIKIWNNNDKCYSCDHLEYQLGINNINKYPLYEYELSNDPNINLTPTISKNYGDKIQESSHFDDLIGENTDKSRRVVKISDPVIYKININDDINSNVVFKDDTGTYRDGYTGEIISNVINIKEENIQINYTPSKCYFIYIGNNETINYNSYIYAWGGGGSQVLDKNKIKILSEYSEDETEQYIIYTGGSGWYRIYKVNTEIHVIADAIRDKDGNLTNDAINFYINRDINQMKFDMINMIKNINLDESDILTDNKINITPKALSSIHQSLFRQIFYHLYYEINDNGKKIKVYDDNNKNAIMHLRMMKSYNYPPSVDFKITNIFGIQLEYSLKAGDTLTWQPINNNLVGPFTPIP